MAVERTNGLIAAIADVIRWRRQATKILRPFEDDHCKLTIVCR